MNVQMSCEAIRTRLSGYHDGELPGPLAEGIRAHLGGCAACRGELEAIGGVAGLVAAAALDARPGAEPGAETAFEDRLARRLAARREAPSPWMARARLARRLSLYAAVALLAAVVGLGPAVMAELRRSAAPDSDYQILYLALMENGSGDQEDRH